MTNLDYFIDTHCHMFTIADIPLYEMVRQLAEDNDAPGKTILYGIVAGFLNLDGKAKEYEKFIRFFENEPSDSVKQICDEITALVNAKGCDSYRFTAAHTITTPMIMDMDLGGNIDKEKKSKVDGQTKRLRDAIAHVKPAVKVLPFVGIDLGRDKKDFAKRLSQIKSIKERGGIAKTHSGDLIGLKLYPALGFEPDKHIDKLKKVVERDIPVTAHCQKGGPKMHDNIDIFTDPENWADVLEKCPQLRINLAHFGGEDGAIDAIDYIFDDTETYPWNTFNGL
jgi:predicted TIM-barrel fold metal-dependent hydrolase